MVTPSFISLDPPLFYQQTSETRTSGRHHHRRTQAKFIYTKKETRPNSGRHRDQAAKSGSGVDDAVTEPNSVIALPARSGGLGRWDKRCDWPTPCRIVNMKYALPQTGRLRDIRLTLETVRAKPSGCIAWLGGGILL